MMTTATASMAIAYRMRLRAAWGSRGAFRASHLVPGNRA
jgi:hypothetical protein